MMKLFILLTMAIEGTIICVIAKIIEIRRNKRKRGSIEFAEWVAEEIFSDNWEYNKDSFEELACRKLEKMGIVRKTETDWELADKE